MFGNTLTVFDGSWKPMDAKIKYQWLRNGKPIPHANGATYKMSKADKYTRITVKVTGTKGGYAPVSRQSLAFIAR